MTISLNAVFQFLIVSGSQRQSMQMFDYCENLIVSSDVLNRFLSSGRGGKHTRTVVRLGRPFGGKMEALPCSPNRLRGKHPDVLLVDEASIVPDEMLASELIMMLTKPGARLIMAGTPFGFDHPFRAAFENPSFSVYHETSYASPLVSRGNLEEWRQMMTEERWTREVEARWVDASDSHFPLDLIRECVDPGLELVADVGRVPAHMSKKPTYGGLDLGKHRDFIALAVVMLDGERLKLVHLHQFPRETGYAEVIAYTILAGRGFNFRKLVVDKTGVGDPIVEELHNIGLANVEGIVLTETNKEEVLSRLRIQMEQRRLAVSYHTLFIDQMNEQQYEYRKPKTAQERIHLKFKHPAGRHDDVLWAFESINICFQMGNIFGAVLALRHRIGVCPTHGRNCQNRAVNTCYAIISSLFELTEEWNR